jgi:hypothetical protein
MPFVLSEREPSATASAVADEEEEVEEGAAAAQRAGERTVQVTPLGVLPYSHNGSSGPAFLLACPAGNGQPALLHVAVGVLGAEEGSSSSSSTSQALALTAYLAPVGAPSAAAAAAALLSSSSSVMKATVVFAVAPPRVLGGAVRPGGATEVSVFPRDPRLACIPDILAGAGALPGSTAGAEAAGTAPGTYRLYLPVHPVGASRASGPAKSGAAVVRTVAAPMPGKVVKVLVEEGAWVGSLLPCAP